MINKEEVDKLLSTVFSKEELKDYNDLGIALGIVNGLMIALEKDGVFETLGEENTNKLKDAFQTIVSFSQLGLEQKITKEKLDKALFILKRNGLS